MAVATTMAVAQSNDIKNNKKIPLWSLYRCMCTLIVVNLVCHHFFSSLYSAGSCLEKNGVAGQNAGQNGIFGTRIGLKGFSPLSIMAARMARMTVSVLSSLLLCYLLFLFSPFLLTITRHGPTSSLLGFRVRHRSLISNFSSRWPTVCACVRLVVNHR